MKFYDGFEQFVKENPDMIYRIWTLKDLENDEDCLKYKICKELLLYNILGVSLMLVYYTQYNGLKLCFKL